MRMECILEESEKHVFVPLSAWVCWFSGVYLFLCRCAFQGRALWWKAAHGWVMLLPTFCLTDSFAAFPPAPHAATRSTPTLPSHHKTKFESHFFFFISDFSLCCCHLFLPSKTLICLRIDDRIKPPVPRNKTSLTISVLLGFLSAPLRVRPAVWSSSLCCSRHICVCYLLHITDCLH